jgi:hypothetical protein
MKLRNLLMSDLELVLEEIEALQGAISSAIYMAKKHGDVRKLEDIAVALGTALWEAIE